eukprot:3529779-Alexandrium_andersonii.AAC.1
MSALVRPAGVAGPRSPVGETHVCQRLPRPPECQDIGAPALDQLRARAHRLRAAPVGARATLSG